jgi:hypothetical protein
MDVYHIWCNLRPGTSDLEFCENVDGYLGELRSANQIGGHRITRRKLGLGPAEFGEFHITIEIEDLAQLDAAFQTVSTRTGAIEDLHHAVNRVACDLKFALYRDFPDAQRARGSEKF